MNVTDTSRTGNTKVFLSYAQADKETARYIADALKRSGVSTLFDEWELQLGDSIIQHIERAVESSDFVLVLLSPAAVKSHWIQQEWSAAFSKELNDRAIRILPVLIADCDIPQLFATRVYLDLRTNREAGVQRLVDQISAAPAIHFSHLTPQDFEKLVADLLTELGFSVQGTSSVGKDRGFDFFATYEARDPFGVLAAQTWIVEAKLYRNSRVSVSVLRELLGVLSVEKATMGLIITNGNLTSEARHFLQSVDRANRLRLIDGTELTSLIVQHPRLVERHFPRSGTRG
jgi:HJR/Mrr/RecB family endonuclease